jgi:hypothetical protein
MARRASAVTSNVLHMFTKGAGLAWPAREACRACRCGRPRNSADHDAGCGQALPRALMICIRLGRFQGGAGHA